MATDPPPVRSRVQGRRRACSKRPGILVTCGLALALPALSTDVPAAAPVDAGPATSPLRVLDTPLPPGWSPRKLMIDAGHGATNNVGTTNARCEEEQAFTRRTQDAVMTWLAGRPGLQLQAGRPTADLVDYQARLRHMRSWPADAVIGVHSDNRAGDGWSQDPRSGCWTSRGATGFAVLYSDEGGEVLVRRRLALATAVAQAMLEAGFHAYRRDGYADYEGVSEGVFVDRHRPQQRVMMLRTSRVPYVIVETHQAPDPAESTLWDEPATQVAFAAALYRAVVQLHGGATPAVRAPSPPP